MTGTNERREAWEIYLRIDSAAYPKGSKKQANILDSCNYTHPEDPPQATLTYVLTRKQERFNQHISRMRDVKGNKGREDDGIDR